MDGIFPGDMDLVEEVVTALGSSGPFDGERFRPPDTPPPAFHASQTAPRATHRDAVRHSSYCISRYPLKQR